MVDISKETIKKRVNIFIHLLKDEEIYLNNNLSSKKMGQTLNISYDNLIDSFEKDSIFLFKLLDEGRNIKYDAKNTLGVNFITYTKDFLNNDSLFYSVLVRRFMPGFFIFDRNKLKSITQKYYNILNN